MKPFAVGGTERLATKVTKEKGMRVLLGTDGSPDAVRAVDWLARFPLPPGSRIMVASVRPRLFPRAPEHDDALQGYARQVIEDARLRLAPRSVEVRLMEGNVRDRLLQTAEDWKADLIVVGARDLSSLERALLGSVSLDLARHARCAVMIVKGTREATWERFRRRIA